MKNQMIKELTREDALRLHRQMWSEMKEVLGDNPGMNDRYLFKRKWCKIHGYEEIHEYCFLCQYDYEIRGYEPSDGLCYCGKRCLIKWSEEHGCEPIHGTGADWRYSPISEILALPERE